MVINLQMYMMIKTIILVLAKKINFPFNIINYSNRWLKYL